MLTLTGASLTLADITAVARHGQPVGPYPPEAVARMQASRAWVEAAVAGEQVVYGVNTGFGSLARERIPPEATRRLSRNLILQCLVGVDAPLPLEIVRAMMLIRANTFARGQSGIRPAFGELLIAMLNRGVTPHVPRKGSLGASGDLAPLAHIAVTLTRDEDPARDESGRAFYQGEWLTGAEALARAGLERLVPEAKEGLALTNGTTFMTAAGALAIHDAENLLRHAEAAAALSIEALGGLSEAYHPALHLANGQPGQVRAAGALRAWMADSQLLDSDPRRVQDAYSLRCTPQVLGPAWDMVGFLRERFTAAVNAASDNPLIFAEEQPAFKVSGGNFHGQGPSLWLDVLGITLAGVGNIAERRVFRLVTPELSNGLPPMLIRASGLESGLMMPQYTAAALVSDNKTLAHPDSVDSIPSSANQEDHVSMGANAARHALEILDNVRRILAIELLTAAQAVDLRPDGPARLGRGTRTLFARVRQHVAFAHTDQAFSEAIETLAQLIHAGTLVEAL